MSGTPYQRPLARGEACLPCRTSKIRCPGERPACTNCVDRHRHCKYPERAEHKRRRTSSEDTIHNTSTSAGVIIRPLIDVFPMVPSPHFPGLSSSVPMDVPFEEAQSPNGIGSSSGIPMQPPVDPIAVTRPPDHAEPPSSTFPQTGETHDPDWLNPHFVNFLPSTGISSSTDQDQHYPNLDQLDLSWLLDTEEMEFGPDPALEGLSVQEHCFRLYFTHQMMFALEMHISTFYTRLSNPDPRLRPHPSLCNAMCLSVCLGSPVASVREQEETFFNNAATALDAAIKDTPTLAFTLLDLTRAAVLLSSWLWGKGRDGEAVIMTSRAVRMCLAGAYDDIPSSNLAHRKPIRLRRARQPFGVPPQTLVELADRIYAFWAVYVLDIAASIPTTMPAGMTVDSIKTPLPQPWSHYETGQIGPDQYLFDLYSPTSSVDTTATTTELGYIIKALSLLHKSQLIHLRSIDTVSSILSRANSTSNLPSESSSGGANLTPPLSSEGQLIYEAIQRFSASLPADMKSTIIVEGGKKTIDPRTANMQFILGCAQMYLFDTNDYIRPNDRALSYAKQMTGVIRLLGGRVCDDAGELSEFICVLWRQIARVLLRESKRLIRNGNDIDAALLDVDVDVILQTIRMYQSSLARGQAFDIAEIRKRPPSDVDEDEEERIEPTR